jgi:hypothetical protein
VVSIEISPSEKSYITYAGMPSPNYQNVINVTACLSLRRGLSASMNVVMREHGFLTTIFSDD